MSSTSTPHNSSAMMTLTMSNLKDKILIKTKRRKRRRKLLPDQELFHTNQCPHRHQKSFLRMHLSSQWRFPFCSFWSISPLNDLPCLSLRVNKSIEHVLVTVVLLFHLCPVILAQSYSSSSSSSASSSPNSFHYIEYNLADYCSEENWSDYPGRHRIRLEKSVKIRRPSIVDFQYNETHRQRLGGNGRYGPRYSVIDSYPYNGNDNQQQSSGPSFVPYCLLSFYADYGYRIYAEGFATGLLNGGKDWFTETLHFRTHSPESDNSAGTGTFVITTHKDSLSLVFEQLHLREFSFHLIITPFRDASHSPEYDHFDGAGGCELDREYRCRNERCIANYLTCDHHNNCGDHSDEATNCLSKVPTTSSTVSTPPHPSPPYPQPPPPDIEVPPTRPQVPTFDINGNRIEPPPRGQPDSGIPEYVDVPLPTDYPPFYPQTTSTRRTFYFDTMNGVGGTATSSGGGFLEDLFTFSSEGKVSNVVYVVRYLLAVLVIIILVTLVNFLIWCLITKRDQSFMAPAASPTPTQRPMSSPQPATSTLSVISDV